MSKFVTVYSPEGTAEKHTLPNARDLVQGAGYSWKPGVEASPVNFAPAHAVPTREEKLALAKKPASQEIFDRYGTTATEADDPLSNADIMEDVLNETTPAEEAAPVVEEVVEPAPEEAPKLTDLPRGRGRGRGV